MRNRCFLLALLLPLAACATPQSLSLEQVDADPWEASNRRVYALNKKLDRYAIKPVTMGYRAVVPRPARNAVSNAYGNYGEPRNFMGYLLQGKISHAFRTLDRFLINTVLGVGGISDAATGLGRPRADTDWGQTFAQWGIKPGPYVVMPFFGPATLRDGIGAPLDFFVDPADFVRNATLSPSIPARAGLLAGRVIEVRDRLINSGADDLLAGSMDEYTLVKSAWAQRRRAQLYYGNPPPTAEELEEYEDYEAAQPSKEEPATPTEADTKGASGDNAPNAGSN